ncbi:rhodanese-like domain-containing protein [Rhodobacter sp. NSM]|uniref:rhodanese-like domain-containing protein n=1 Tax=Rhodobacter sp. NSM TaxID=3457501 RepID=UPI003FD07126
MAEVIPRALPEARQLCPSSTRKALAAGALLVDVREADEQAAVGFAEAEVLSIPLSQFEARVAEVPRDREVVVACASGPRSLKAVYYLMYQGHDRVANLDGGLSRWAAKGFPVRGDAAALTALTRGCTEGASCCGGDVPATKAEDCCGGDGRGHC